MSRDGLVAAKAEERSECDAKKYGFCFNTLSIFDFPGGSDSKASAYTVGDLGSIPGSGRSPEKGNGNPLQYSCLENPIDGGA